jgi:hypothetical protein
LYCYFLTKKPYITDELPRKTLEMTVSALFGGAPHRLQHWAILVYRQRIYSLQ